METIIIKNYPLGISENIAFAGKSRRYCSPEYANYKRWVEQWHVKNWTTVVGYGKEIDKYLLANPLNMIQVDTYFCFELSRLITKKGKLKKIDPSNFVKPCHDTFADCLGVDDSKFKCGAVDKIAVDCTEKERVVIVLTPSRLMSIKELETARPELCITW